MSRFKNMIAAVSAIALSAGTAYAQFRNDAEPAAAEEAGKTDSTVVITLDQALRIALSENVSVKVADMEIKKSEYAKKGTYAALFPQIDISGAYQRTIKKQVMYMDFDMSSLGGGAGAGEGAEEGTVVVAWGVGAVADGGIEEAGGGDDEAAFDGFGEEEGFEGAAGLAAGDGGIDLAGGGGGEVEGAEVDDGVGRGGAEDDAGAIGDAGEAGEVAAEEGEGVGLEFAIDGVAGEEGVAVFVGLGEALEVGAVGGVSEAEDGRGVGFVGLRLGEFAAADHHV